MSPDAVAGPSTLTVVHYRSKGLLQLLAMLLHFAAFVAITLLEVYTFMKVGLAAWEGWQACPCARDLSWRMYSATFDTS